MTCVSLYWHFVDMVWMLLFTIMYILPSFTRLRSNPMPAAAAHRRDCRRRAVNRTLQWVVWSALGIDRRGRCWRGVRAPAVARDGTARHRTLDQFNTVPEFTLTERNGQPFDSAATLKGKVWLANFFFTACPGPCLRMNGRLQEIQQALDHDNHADVRIVSFSIAPEMDTPAVLRKYAERFHASPDQWSFLTGRPRQIYDLAHKVFMLPTSIKRARTTPPTRGIRPQHEDRAGGPRGRRARIFDSTNPEVLQQVLTGVGDFCGKSLTPPPRRPRPMPTLPAT